MSNDIEKEIISIIANVSGFEENEIRPQTNLQDALEIDSIKAIEITVAIEKKFKIAIRDEDISAIQTVQDAITKVNDALSEKESA